MNIDEFVNKYGGGSQSAPSSNNEKLNNLITKYSNGSTQNTAISSVPTTNQTSVANSSTAPVKSSESAQISNEYLAKKYNLPTNYSDSFDNGYNASNKIRKDLKSKGVTENDIEPLTEYYTKQVQNKYLKAAQDLAELRPGYATALSVPVQLLAGVRNTVDTIADKISGRETKDYSKGAFAQNVVDTLRGTVTENIDSNVGKTAYGIGTSIGDMALNLALHTGPVGMGLEKASSTKNEAIERGLSDGQVIGEMVTSGLTTAITEAIPMGKIKKIADAGFGELGKVTLKSVIKKVGASMASEGVQEMSEDVADMIADRLIAKDQNQIALEVKSYKNQGLSDDEAKKKVFWDNVQQTVLDGVAGAISGGVMAGAGGGVYALNQRLNPTAQNVQQNTQEEITNNNVNTSENQAGPAPTEPIINNLPVDNSQNIPYVQNTGEINNGQEQTVNRGTDSGNIGPEQLNTVDSSISGRNEKGRSYTTRDGRVYPLRDVVSDDLSRLMDAASISNANIFDKSNDTASFSKQLADAKMANPNGRMVSNKTPEELKGARIFADNNKSVGVAVMPDGDIVGVHKNPKLNSIKGVATDLILTARENGGTKLDCYGEKLVRMYSELGFKPVARVEWNETFKPEDWGDNKPETVYVMMRDERSSNQVVTDLITGKNPVMESKDLDSLPMYSVKEYGKAAYDEALKYRDDLLAKQSGKQGAFSNAQNVPTLNNASIKLQNTDNNLNSKIPTLNNVSSSTNSDGEALSSGQERYFQNSKARDDSGRLLKLYHGTTSAGFNVFDRSFVNEGFFFTDDFDIARTYSNSPDVYAPKYIRTEAEALAEIESLRPGTNNTIEKVGDNYVLNQDGETYEGKTLGEIVDAVREEAMQGANYAVYANTVNPLIVDANGSYWDEINFNGETTSTNELAAYAEENGYDGLIVKNVIDNGSKKFDTSTDVVVFASNQIKSTANDNPSSENDIRSIELPSQTEQQIPRARYQVMNEDTGLNESEELPTLEFTMSDVNRGRAIYENADRMKATQYATNTASQLARDNGIEEEFQQMVDDGEFGADVIHNADSKEEANRLKEKAMALKGNYNEEVEKLMSKDDFNSIDQDELQLIISEEMDKARESGNFDTVRDFVKKATAKIHSIGEALQALAKYSGTASSAIIKTQTMIEGEIQNRVAPDSKRGKASSKLAKALAQMGDDTKAQNEAQPKTHEQVRSEVIETLKKEFSSIFSKFTNNDIEYITRLVEDKGTSVNSLQDELEHYFKHGSFYTLDESIPVPSAKNSRLATILKNIGNKQSTQEKVEKNPGQIREEIINTLSDENASILNDLTDRELDFITDMIMDRSISDDIIADELEYRMKNGEFYTLDESVVEAKPRSFQIAKALDVAINGEQPKVEKPAKTLQQIKEEVRNTILDEASGISDNFTNSDIDFLANRIQRGTTQEELNDLIRQKLATGKWEISDADIEKVNALYDEINSGLLTSREVWQKTNQASKILASYLGDGTALEKMNQWRYFAMLSAPSTHLKNIISTSNFSLITMLKDAVAAQGEKIYKAKNQDFERTKSVLSLKDKGTIKSAWKDFVDWAYNDYASQGSHYNDKSVIKQNQQVTKSKGLNWLYNANSDLLSNEDIVMGRIKYAQALAGYLKANGKNSDIFTSRNVNDQELLNRAREYALQEAKVATFHEDNKAADLLTRISKSAEEGGGVEIFGKRIPLLNFAIEGFVPFKKTTMNVGKQFIKEYNPVTAIIRSIAGTHKDNPTEIINDYAKSATGAGLMALGLWLGNAGLLVASKDDDDKSDVLNQDQEYALHYINKDGNEVTYTLDGLAPSANLLIVGALLAKEGITAQMLGEMGDMYIESSLLKGFENFFNSVTSSTYDKKKTKPVTIGANLADNYVSQFIPTLSGKLNRTIDATRRDTSHTGLEGNLDTFARLGKKYLNKLPGTSFLNQPYINKYGEEEKNVGKNALDRFLYNMFSIGYYSERKVDDIQTEIQRLQEIASDENTDETTRESINNELGKIFGSVETSYNGEKLNPLKYTEFEKSVGKEKAKNISALVNSDGYQKLSPLQQAEALNEMDNFSEAVAKNKTFDYNIANSNSYKKNYEIYQRDGIKGLTDYLATDAIIKEKVGDQTGNVPKLNALSSLDMTDKEKGKYLYDSMNLTKAAERAFDSKGYEGIYQAYILKQRIDPSGTVSQEEMINYLNSSNMSNSEKSYWFDIFFPTAKNKPIFE